VIVLFFILHPFKEHPPRFFFLSVCFACFDGLSPELLTVSLFSILFIFSCFFFFSHSFPFMVLSTHMCTSPIFCYILFSILFKRDATILNVAYNSDSLPYYSIPMIPSLFPLDPLPPFLLLPLCHFLLSFFFRLPVTIPLFVSVIS